MIDRRKFIKSLSAFGITLPLLKSELLAKSKSVSKNNPIILCSRGEKWGRKSLRPGWEVLRKKGRFLMLLRHQQMLPSLILKILQLGMEGYQIWRVLFN